MKFETFLETELQALADLAGALTANRQDAHDLLVHSLWNAKDKWARTRVTGRPLQHATRVLLTTYIFQKHTLDNRPAQGSEPSRSDGRSASDPVAYDDGPVSLKVLIDQLSRTQRTMVVLRFFFEYDHREIAAAVGLPVRQARSTLSRALAALRLSPEESEQDAEDLRRALAERGQHAPDPSRVRADLQLTPQEVTRRRRAAVLMIAIAVVAVAVAILTIASYVARERPVTSDAAMAESVTNDWNLTNFEPGIKDVQPR